MMKIRLSGATIAVSKGLADTIIVYHPYISIVNGLDLSIVVDLA